jgi:putative peptide zinc metalloprotease protein
VAGIAPNGDFQAILLVDQADRRDLYSGQPVDFKLEHLPDRTFSGVVGEISQRERQFVPRILSNKFGGELPTVTDAQGREKLSGGVAYQAKVRLNEDTSLLSTGMRGRARFLVSSRTAGEWIWQYCRRTFHFRL